MLYLPIWHQNVVGKIWCKNIGWGREGERRHTWEGHTYPKENFAPHFYWGGPELFVVWMVYGVTVNRELACPAALHPKSGEAGTCPRLMIKGGHYPDVHGLFEGCGDAL